jgi:integrase/recombinase XerD
MTSATSPEAISPLRARMIEDMTVRNFGADTQRDYIRCVKKLAAFLGRSPDTATAEDLRRFQIDLVGSGATPSTANSTVTALRFSFSTTVDQPDRTRHLALVHQPRKIPVVLSLEEVVRLLEMTPGVKYQTAFSVTYGAGLRVSEVAALKVSDIDSDRMRLRVEQGKGRKDRETMLTIAADPKHLGAKIGIISVLHTWGSAMTHYPHVHMIVPGGGLSADGNRWMHASRASSWPCGYFQNCFDA